MAQKMAVYQNFTTDRNGNIVPNCPYEVRAHTSGNPLVSLFSDRNGTVTKTNGFASLESDDDGFIQFFVAGGAFKVVVQIDGEERELDYVAVGTAAEYDARDLLFAIPMHFVAGGKFTAAFPLMPFDVYFPCTLFASDKDTWIAKVRTPPNGDRTISIVKNGVQFATVTILNGALTGTFTMAADAELVLGDQVWPIMPSPLDTAMADFSMVLVARK